MQLTATPIIEPTTRGHDFSAQRHRHKRRLSPLETVDRIECDVAPTTQRVYCPSCEKAHAVAVDYRYEYRDDGVPCQVSRMCFCDHCDQLFWWDQVCDGQGSLFGRPLKGSLVINNKPSLVEQALKLYPQLRGIEQI
jgi:hypothetical protein